jgi:hypothetical protein
MYQVAAPIWNRIAEEGRLCSSAGKRLFHLNQDQLTIALDLEAKRLKDRGYDPAVILALLVVGPLFVERDAIRHYVAKHSQYRHALPEVNSIQEAVILADLEYELTLTQQKELDYLLRMLEIDTLPPCRDE